MAETKPDNATLETPAVDPLNVYAGDFSETFIQALRSGDTAQCLLMLEQKQVALLDDGQISHWMQERGIYIENETTYRAIIEELKADIVSLEQPLAALRPALLGAMHYFEENEKNPKKEDSKWRVARTVMKGLKQLQRVFGDKSISKAEKKAQDEMLDTVIDGVLAVAKFAVNNKDVLGEVLASAEIVPAYQTIQKHELITPDEIARIAHFAESKLKQIAPPATNSQEKPIA